MTAAAEGPPPPDATCPLRVVIIEDHELLATSLVIALRQQGLEAEFLLGPGPEEMVSTVRRLAPVLVLLDLDLGPALGSGVSLIRPLIESGGRVVMLTGIVDRILLAACVEAGAAGIVSKSAGFGDLVEAVQRAADGEELLTLRQRQELLDELRAWRHATDDRLAPFSRLSARERDVLAGLMAGETAEAIAARSFVSLSTVRTQIRAVLGKLGVTTQLAAVALARRAGWMPPPQSVPNFINPADGGPTEGRR